MPAPGRRPVSLHEHSTGRRLTSLEGGNRGVLRCGYFNVSGYGDLKAAFSVKIDNAAAHWSRTSNTRAGYRPV